MAQILSFPSQRQRKLDYLDQQIRQLLTDRGADEELIDYAAEQLTSIYNRANQSENYQLDLEIPPDISESDVELLKQRLDTGLNEFIQQNHAIMVELVAQLVLTRVQLFQCERG